MLRAYELPVRVHTTREPGLIVHRDALQIAAIGRALKYEGTGSSPVCVNLPPTMRQCRGQPHHAH
jgi:hypothetical protein